MRRWLVIIMVLILAVVCLSSCSKDEDKASSSPEKKTTTSNAEQVITSEPSEQKTISDEQDLSEQKTISESSEQVIKMDVNEFKKVGNIVTFGRFEQDYNLENGMEPIEWVVLDVRDNKALLISNYTLIFKCYNDYGLPPANWENCTLRAWLNNEFYQHVFSAEEKSAILLTNVVNRVDGKVWYSNAADTQDYIFLLSMDEAYSYFPDDESRIRYTTRFAEVSVYYQEGEHRMCPWWVRSSYDFSYEKAPGFDYIQQEGQGSMTEKYDIEEGVCPVLWIDLNSDFF